MSKLDEGLVLIFQFRDAINLDMALDIIRHLYAADATKSR